MLVIPHCRYSQYYRLYLCSSHHYSLEQSRPLLPRLLTGVHVVQLKKCVCVAISAVVNTLLARDLINFLIPAACKPSACLSVPSPSHLMGGPLPCSCPSGLLICASLVCNYIIGSFMLKSQMFRQIGLDQFFSFYIQCNSDIFSDRNLDKKWRGSEDPLVQLFIN